VTDESTQFDDVAGRSADKLDHFRKTRWLHNHWSRPIGPRAYYWYLTFENSEELHSLARHCQEAISFPYYDQIAMDDLHLTLDRVAFEGEIESDRLDAIEAAAVSACRSIPPLRITIDSLGGTPGAVGFAASPAQPIRHLRDALRTVTTSVHPLAPTRDSELHPHVAIAYCNSDGISATEAIAAVEKAGSESCVDLTIEECTLVLLERRSRSYSRRAVSRIPLSG